MFNKFSLSARRFALLTSCGLLLASTTCQKEADISPIPSAATSSQDAKGIKEPVNKGKYLSFASSADFLEMAAQLDKLEPGETSAQHLEKWEKKYGFSSLRAHYAKKRKEKEEQAKSGGLTTLRLPEGEGEPPFEPYEEYWEEGLIIEDDFFAAMLSPEGTIQIEDKIYHIDLANNIVSYIYANQPTGASNPETTYDQFIVAQPTVSNEDIRYFSLNDDVLNLTASGQEGGTFGADFRGGITIGSGLGCGSGAEGDKVARNQYYSKTGRMDCKVVYQPLGIYFSMVAKAHHQKKTWYGAWLPQDAVMYIVPTPGGVWLPKCETASLSNYSSYTNYYSTWNGDDNGDRNTVVHRYFNEMKGMKSYTLDVRFRVGQYTSLFSILASSALRGSLCIVQGLPLLLILIRVMNNFRFILLLAGLLNLLSLSRSVAQAHLYLDVKAGANYTFAEGAYFGKGTYPFKARYLRFDEQATLMLRLQTTDKIGVSAGYSGSTLGWGYNLRVPSSSTHNPYRGEWAARATGLYMHQFPVLINRTVGRYNIHEIDTLKHLYLVSFKLDIVGGIGINRLGNSCLDCGSLSGGGLYDTIDFRQTILVRHKWGASLLGGVTARFYRLGKERLNLSLYYTQGMTNMIMVPVEYKYNSQGGSSKLYVRGSGLSATLGFPIRLKTFKPPTIYNRN